MNRVSIPFPPSLNNAFVQYGKRRIKSRRYATWRMQAHLIILAERLPAIAGPVQVSILLVPPNMRRRDADNHVKPILDALVEAGALAADDRRILRKVTAEWSNHCERTTPHAVVTISAWIGEAQNKTAPSVAGGAVQ